MTTSIDHLVCVSVQTIIHLSRNLLRHGLVPSLEVGHSIDLAAQTSFADVTPAPEPVGKHDNAAKTPEEHAAAAEHNKKMSEYCKSHKL